MAASTHVVQVRCPAVRDEKLAAHCVRPAVCKADDTSSIVPQIRVELVVHLPAADGSAAFARPCWIAALNDEARDVAVEQRAIVRARRRKRQEVLRAACGWRSGQQARAKDRHRRGSLNYTPPHARGLLRVNVLFSCMMARHRARTPSSTEYARSRGSFSACTAGRQMHPPRTAAAPGRMQAQS